MADDRVHVRVGGQPWRTDPENVQSVQQAGGKVISEQEAQQGSQALSDLSYVDENWGSAGKFGMGALSGLTLGMGPGALAAAGLVNPGHLGAAQESGLYTAGDVAGTALPAFLSGGESLGARAAAMTPAGLLGGLGTASERFAAGLFGNSAGLLGRMGSQPIKMAARGMTEGALINMGHTIGDGLLTNKPLSAEALAASGADGALFGGLMGAGFGTVGSLGGMAVDSLGSITKNMAGRGAKGLGTMAKSVGIDELGPDIGVAKTKMGQIGEILHDNGSSFGDSVQGKLSATKRYIEIHEVARKEAIEELGRDVTGAIESLEKRLAPRLNAEVIAPVVGTPQEAWANSSVKSFLKSLERTETKVAPVVEEGIHIPSERTKVESLKVKGGLGGEPVFKESPEINRPGTDLPGYQASEPMTWKKVIQARDQLASGDSGIFKTEILNLLDSEIRAAMESAGMTPGVEGVAEKYTAATTGIKLARELEGHLGKKASAALMSSGGPVSARDVGTFVGMTAIGHPMSGLAWLSAKGIGNKMMGRYEPWMAQMAYNNTFGTKAAAATQNMQSKIGESLRSYFKSTAKSASKVPSKAAIVDHVEKAHKEPSAKERMDRKGFEDTASRAEQLMSRNHQDKVQQYLESMHQAGYQELAAAMMGVNQRAIQYGMWITPPRQVTKGMNSLRPMPVSKVPTLQEYKFMRGMKGINKGPLGVLEDMKDGKVSRDQVQAMAYVYPEAAQYMAQTFAEEVVAMKTRGDTLPMDKITNLAMALNAPIDRTLEADYVSAVQVSLNAPPADKPPPTPDSPSGGMTIDKGMMTPLQTITFA